MIVIRAAAIMTWRGICRSRYQLYPRGLRPGTRAGVANDGNEYLAARAPSAVRRGTHRYDTTHAIPISIVSINITCTQDKHHSVEPLRFVHK